MIIHDDCEHYFDAIKARCPDVEICSYAPSSLRQDIENFAPQVVFSWKTKSIPLSAQRTIVTLPSVEWLHIAGAGFEHLLPLPDHLTVTNSSGVCSAFMAETVLAAILMWNFGFPRYIELQRERSWQKFQWKSVSEKTVLIIGVGSIGSKVAQYTKAVGMRVIGVKNRPTAVPAVDEMVAPADLHDVLAQADYVCVHVPLTQHTRSLLGARELARMKSNAILINTARGGVVDEQALATALVNHQIGGAYLDVFADEPLAQDSELWSLPNLIISPHVSDSVADWQTRFVDFFIDNLNRWQASETLVNIVDPELGY